MSDPTGLDAAHPALVTAAGPPGTPSSGDPTGLDAAHPALVTATGPGRPRAAARLSVAARKDPGLFRTKGLSLAVVLDAPATVSVVALHPTGRKLTRTAKTTADPGRLGLRLRPSVAGRALSRRRRGTGGRVVARIAYRDGATETLTKEVALRRRRG